MTKAHLLIVLAASAAPLAFAQAPASDAPAFTGQVLATGQMRVGRYTTVQALPAAQAADPLATYVRITYPRQTVRTVGDALRHTLLRTGWQLSSETALSADASRLMTLPLPESQRTLGPYTVRTVLEVLTGPSWRWHEDAMQRVVWFNPQPVVDAPPTVPAQPATTAQPGQSAPDAAHAAVTRPVVTHEVTATMDLPPVVASGFPAASGNN